MSAEESASNYLPPLPPGIQTTILSHLFPPTIPLPQQLLSKSLLQRHLYLPPSPTDVDAWLAPLPEKGLSEKLERLAGVGWGVDDVGYGSDGESVLARVKVVEESGEESVDVLFELEAGKDGRGWTYLSAGTAPTLDWRGDTTHLTLDTSPPPPNEPSTASATTELSNGIHVDDHSAPEGYWSGFSPPSSPTRPQEPEGEGGEDDYWASYDNAFTPGGVTPAAQRSPTQSSQAQLPAVEDDIKTTSPNGLERDGSGEGEGLLKSRMEMKIASLLRKLWTDHEPTSDPEHRALTFLSLARTVQTTNLTSTAAATATAGVSGKMEMLFEIYGVLEKDPQVAAEGFYRLVEGSLSAGQREFGWGDRQDSSAQLNYWE